MAARFPLQALALAISTSFLLTACSEGEEPKAPSRLLRQPKLRPPRTLPSRHLLKLPALRLKP